MLGSQTHRITHLIGQRNYTCIYFTDAPSLLISRTLSYCTDLLPSFIRLHRMCAVNPAFIDEVHLLGQQPGVVVGKTRLPISRRRLAEAARRLETARN
ncbi:hypothetical protein GCM10028773_44500 [Spirosoma koreense]